MVKTYYRNEYTEKQWKALIDKAAELGCQVTYGRYGDRAEIDSTDLRCCRRAQTSDTAKAIARLSARARSQQSRSVSREQQVLNGQ